MQLFLLFDVFLAGALAATAIRHAYAHFRPHEHDLEKSHTPQQNGHLPPSVREKLLAEAQTNFQAVLSQSASELQKDLQSTASEIKKQVDKFSSEATSKEVEHYRATLDELEKKTEDDIGAMDKEMVERQAELRTKLEQEMATEKEHLLQQIDTKLADAMASFLMETLQHNVDLGAQSAYLTTMLEEHKAEFTKGVNDEV